MVFFAMMGLKKILSPFQRVQFCFPDAVVRGRRGIGESRAANPSISSLAVLAHWKNAFPPARIPVRSKDFFCSHELSSSLRAALTVHYLVI